MSDTCPACYQNSCPEAVSTININQTTVTMDGATLGWYNEYITTASGTYDSVSNTVTLANMPVSPAAVQLSLNSGVQGQNPAAGLSHNFSVTGNIVSLHFTPAADDILHFHYMAYAGTVSNDIPVGTKSGYEGATAPAGWLFMDGVTSHLIASYPALYSFAHTNLELLSHDATSFILKLENTNYTTVGGLLIAGATIIKT